MTGQIEKEQLKSEIFEKVREYYRLVHQPAQGGPFLPGKSRVNYAGRVFDEAEMVNLVDSALDFWLTHGDYANRFEQALADYLGVRWALLVNSGSSANLLAFMALTSPCLASGSCAGMTRSSRWPRVFPPRLPPSSSTGRFPFLSMSTLKTATSTPGNWTRPFPQEPGRSCWRIPLVTLSTWKRSKSSARPTISG